MKSELLQELDARGFINQSSNLDGLNDALNAGRVTAYWGTDPTGDSLHVGHLASLMLMRWFQKYGHRPIALVGGAAVRCMNLRNHRLIGLRMRLGLELVLV